MCSHPSLILLSSFVLPLPEPDLTFPKALLVAQDALIHLTPCHTARCASSVSRVGHPGIFPPNILTLSPLLKAFFICRCYSAYEHSKFHQNSPRTSHLGSTGSAPTPIPRLPLDISLETILSVFLVCVGLVLGEEELKPITWRVWAGQAERESGGGGPFQALEERLGFMDIRVRCSLFAFASPHSSRLGLYPGHQEVFGL